MTDKQGDASQGRARSKIDWRPVATDPPPDYDTVLLARSGDLYPVAGARMGGEWVLEEGGAEDDERRCYPLMWWEPTHWATLPEVP